MRTDEVLDGSETATAERPDDENLLLLFSFFYFFFFFFVFFACVYVQLCLDLQREPMIEEMALGLEVTAEQVKGYDRVGFSSRAP